MVESKSGPRYEFGFIHAQLATNDASGGVIQTIPGLSVRFECEEVFMYRADEPGVVCLHLRSLPKEEAAQYVEIMASIEEIDRIMKRHRSQIKEVR